MGTRNLTCIVKDGEYKATKYCQWDGQPSGQGQSIIDFLVTSYDPEIFVKHLQQGIELSSTEVEERWKHCETRSEFDVQNSRDFHLHRDMGGGEFFNYIQETENPEFGPNDAKFAGGSLFCEWCYVLDLDQNRLEIFKGFNKNPLTYQERFLFLQTPDSKYYPVKFLVAFDISSNLKKEWLDWFAEYTQELED